MVAKPECRRLTQEFASAKTNANQKYGEDLEKIKVNGPGKRKLGQGRNYGTDSAGLQCGNRLHMSSSVSLTPSPCASFLIVTLFAFQQSLCSPVMVRSGIASSRLVMPSPPFLVAFMVCSGRCKRLFTSPRILGYIPTYSALFRENIRRPRGFNRGDLNISTSATPNNKDTFKTKRNGKIQHIKLFKKKIIDGNSLFCHNQ